MYFKFTLVILSVFFCFSSIAQSEQGKLPTPNASNVFVELGGNGGFLSINYDTRFSKTGRGLGARIGIGFIPAIDFFIGETSTILTIPLALNYLAGKGPHYFEAGAGVTYATGRTELFGEESTSSGFAFIPSAGYRFQPLSKGITGRAFISPFISEGGSSFFGGISAGYRF